MDDMPWTPHSTRAGYSWESKEIDAVIGARHRVGAGDLVSFPAGVGGAHKFVNDSDGPCVMLALGTEDAEDVSEYLDSEKIRVKARLMIAGGVS